MTTLYLVAPAFRAWIDRSGLSLTQTGVYLGVSRRTVARWQKEGVQSQSAAKLIKATDLLPGADDGFRWSGVDAPAASRLAGGHVGGLSAAICYGWSVQPPSEVNVYVPGAEEGEVREFAGALEVRVMPCTLNPSVATSVRVDGQGRTLLASDPLRAVVECTLDPLLLGEPMQEIIRNAHRNRITDEEILGHAALHGAEVVENVRAALAMAA